MRDKAAGIFHVFTHCGLGAPSSFATTSIATVFLRELARGRSRLEWTCVGFCLMTTHYHVILDVEDGALPVGMHVAQLPLRGATSTSAIGMKGHVQFAPIRRRSGSLTTSHLLDGLPATW